MTAQEVDGRQYTTDWSRSISYWPDMFKTLGLVGKPHLHFLEIGCFEGRTTVWLLENVLTDPTSRITVIDTFEGSPEFEPLGIDCNFRERFEQNVSAYKDKVLIWSGYSDVILKDWWHEVGVGVYDFIYVDGSHEAADVLSDAVLSWPLLKPGGVMAFDDYKWGLGGPDWARPGPAIDAFVRCYAQQLKGGPQGMDQYVVIKQ